jgi:hypothetical protein
MDQRAEFIKCNGEIGEIYKEDEWMLRFGFFCTGYSAGYDAALKLAEGQKPSTNIRMDGITLKDLESYAVSFAATTLCTICDSRHAVSQFIKFLEEQRRHA